MIPKRLTDDAELVRHSQRGNRAAFSELVRRYEHAAFATALTHVRNREDAQDIVQEAFIAAYCKIVQLREPGCFGRWLRSIVAECSLNWHRRTYRRQAVVTPAGDTSAEQAQVWERHNEVERRHSDLWDAVCALPDKFREVILLHYLNDFSYRDIALSMGVPETTIKARLYQSRIRLKEQLLPG